MTHKVLLAAVAAALLLAATAGARNLSLSSQTWRATWGRVPFTGFFGNIECELTLEGTLHNRTMAKTVGSLIGYVTAARIGRCPEGTATVLTETLPWHVRYEWFTGTLPNITAIGADVIGMSVRTRDPGGFICLFRTSATEPAETIFNREAGGALTSMVQAGEILSSCGARTTILMRNSVTLTVLNSATRITVTLI